MSYPGCGKFQIDQQTIVLQTQRLREAIEFAQNHDLPIPAGIADMVTRARAAGIEVVEVKT